MGVVGYMERVGHSMCLHQTQERFKDIHRNPMLIKLILKCKYNFRASEKNDTAAPRTHELLHGNFSINHEISPTELLVIGSPESQTT